MNEPQAADVEATVPGARRRGGRTARSDQTFVPTAAAVDAARGQAMAASETLLVASRKRLASRCCGWPRSTSKWIVASTSNRISQLLVPGFRDLLAQAVERHEIEAAYVRSRT